MNTCKYEKMQRWVSYDSGITWSPMDEYQKGELIERDSVDCGYTPTPPTPEVEYRWVDIPLADDFYCSGTTKYYKQKMQQSEDSGTTWTDVVPPQYRMGASAQSESSDCGYASRTTSGSPYCDDGNKVVMIYYQVSDDHGASWTTTSSTENIIEYDVAECGYATRTTSGSPYCVGVDKCVDLYHQVTRDGGTTWTTTSTTVSVIEYNSEDCGYVPHDYSKDYLTLVALEDFTFSLINVGGTREYSLDSGETWNSLGWETISVQSGHTVMLKGRLVSNSCPSNYPLTVTSGAFDVEGNLMSLLYGDDFEDKLNLNDFKFYSLFRGSTGLRNAENMILPATALTLACYGYMFIGCTSLTRAPKLPATTLADSCYYGMFSGCTSLTTAPELPATTLATSCYGSMFAECSSLTETQSVLPATTETDNCYFQMFRGCTSLTRAPEILLKTIYGTDCYAMFAGCTSLSAITCLATSIVMDGTYIWVIGVSPTGIFVKDASMNGWPSGNSGIPNGWTVLEDPTSYRWVDISGTCVGYDYHLTQKRQYSLDSGQTWQDVVPLLTNVVVKYDSVQCQAPYNRRYLTFRAREDGTFKLSGNSVSYSLDDGETWQTLADNTDSPTVQSGSTIMWKGNLTPSYGIGTFSSTGYFDVEGNIMSLLYGDNFKLQTTLGKNYAFYKLFQNNKIVNAENLSIPATTLTKSCYYDMFYNCTSLTRAPQLPATTLADRCYYEMFRGCESLTTAPELPATTLADHCYYEMFGICHSLTTAPVLSATTLTEACYFNMFFDCRNLNYIKCLATNISASNCTLSWVQSVSPTGIFVKDASMNGWPSGYDGIPNGWTIQDAT